MNTEKAQNFLGLLCYSTFMDSLGHKKFKPFNNISKKKQQAWIKTAIELEGWISRYYKGDFNQDNNENEIMNL